MLNWPEIYKWQRSIWQNMSLTEVSLPSSTYYHVNTNVNVFNSFIIYSWKTAQPILVYWCVKCKVPTFFPFQVLAFKTNLHHIHQIICTSYSLCSIQMSNVSPEIYETLLSGLMLHTDQCGFDNRAVGSQTWTYNVHVAHVVCVGKYPYRTMSNLFDLGQVIMWYSSVCTWEVTTIESWIRVIIVVLFSGAPFFNVSVIDVRRVHDVSSTTEASSTLYVYITT